MACFIYRGKNFLFDAVSWGVYMIKVLLGAVLFGVYMVLTQ